MAEYINMSDLEIIYCRKGCAECKNEMCLDEMLRGLPTIDIVHCYKCKHYEKYTEHTGFCNHFVVNGERLAMEYDWFCADGERRTE